MTDINSKHEPKRQKETRELNTIKLTRQRGAPGQDTRHKWLGGREQLETKTVTSQTIHEPQQKNKYKSKNKSTWGKTKCNPKNKNTDHNTSQLRCELYYLVALTTVVVFRWIPTNFVHSNRTVSYLSLSFSVFWYQVEEELEVSGHCSSYLVHTHRAGNFQALYQVRPANKSIWTQS